MHIIKFISEALTIHYIRYIPIHQSPLVSTVLFLLFCLFPCLLTYLPKHQILPDSFMLSSLIIVHPVFITNIIFFLFISFSSIPEKSILSTFSASSRSSNTSGFEPSSSFCSATFSNPKGFPLSFSFLFLFLFVFFFSEEKSIFSSGSSTRTSAESISSSSSS